MIGYYNINPGGSGMPEDAFGPRFFKTRFYTWIREACSIDGTIPVLEIMLTSGQVLDVSHISELKDDYMLVSAFIDERDCADTYHTYIRYQTIYCINVLNKSRKERTMGFNVAHEPRLIASESRLQKAAAETAQEYTKRLERENEEEKKDNKKQTRRRASKPHAK